MKRILRQEFAEAKGTLFALYAKEPLSDFQDVVKPEGFEKFERAYMDYEGACFVLDNGTSILMGCPVGGENQGCSFVVKSSSAKDAFEAATIVFEAFPEKISMLWDEQKGTCLGGPGGLPILQLK